VFDGNLHHWTTVFGDGDPLVFGFTEPVNLGSFQIYWHYGGAYHTTGAPGRCRARRVRSRLEGGRRTEGPWTTVLEEPGTRRRWRAPSFPRTST
jgi:hypothetical protein